MPKRDKTGTPKFSLQNQRVHLKYNDHLSDEVLEQHLFSKLQHLGFMQRSWCHEVGKELDPAKQYPHTHVYVHTQQMIKTQSERFFDIVIDNKINHPNIKVVTSQTYADNILKYHKKEEIYVKQIPELVQFDTCTIAETAPSLKEACQSLRINPKSIQDVQCLRSHMSRSPTQARYTADQFTAPLLENVEVAYIWGPAGTGKTNWALAHFKCPLLVRHIDGVKQFQKGIHDGIIFDDCGFKHWPREACIALTDWDYDSDVHARHYCAFIPAHTPKIFTANHPIEDNFPTIDDALLRRIKHIVHVTKDLRKESQPVRTPIYMEL